MPPTYYLFVYGSLRSGFKHPAYEYISRFFQLAGEGRAKGRLYDMGEYPAAVPDEEGYHLVGELYRIKDENEFSWAMAQLDDYEGVKTEAGDHPPFRRDLTEVECMGVKQLAWIYWYNSDTTGRPWIESGDVLQFLQARKQL